MISLLLTHAWAAGPVAFHPGMGSVQVEVRPDGTLVGSPGRVRHAVVLRSTDPDAIARLPEVAEIEHGPRGRLMRIAPVEGTDPVAWSNTLRDRPDVLWAHPDIEVQLVPHQLPDDTYFGDQWHLLNTGQRGYTLGVDINAEEAWDLTRGAGMIVAVIDTGVDIDHPDLIVTDGYDYVSGDESSDPEGDDAHGTAVAGLSAGIGDNGLGTAGVAYEGESYGIRLIGGYTGLYEMYEAFVEAVDAGAVVLNNSWGFDSGCSDIPLYAEISEAIDYAEQEGRGGKGSVVVFSAGNGDCDITNDGLQSHPAVVSVAAIDGHDVREGYSSWGPWLDISAPSGRMATTDIIGPPGYGSLDGDNDYIDDFNGTSASAPVISGVYALMFAVNERLTAAEARDVMCDTAVRMDLEGGEWDENGWSQWYGCGRVDAGAAVRAVYNEGPPDAPVIEGPIGDVEEGRVLLEWTVPEDPDGDRLTYKLKWWVTGDPDNDRNEVTDRPWLDLSEELPVGAEITYKVRALDMWGSGEWSLEQSLSVVRPEVQEIQVEDQRGGCTVAPTHSMPAIAILAILMAGIRRRT